MQKIRYAGVKRVIVVLGIVEFSFLNTVLATTPYTRDSILHVITGAAMPETTYSITHFGAQGDGQKDCKPAFDIAMKTALQEGGAHIIVPAGVFLLNGPIHLVDNVCIELKEGAVLRFSPESQLYLPMVPTSWEGTYLYNYSPFIYGYGLRNVSIMGKGTIDGNSKETFVTWTSLQKESQMLSREQNHKGVNIENRRFGEGYFLRPHLIQLYRCEGITIEDVFITNSPFWCIHLLESENIICRGISYDSKQANNDGIDPECSRNILIENIYFDNGDDNIAIKSGRDNDGWTYGCPSENIIIRNCHFKGPCGVVIGSEMSAGVQNVFVENCNNAGYCKRGIFVKTNPDRGGFVRNIYVNNCVFDEVEDLFYVTSTVFDEGLDNYHFPEIENLRINGLKCRKVRRTALMLQGSPKRPVHDVEFNNIEVDECKIAISFENTEAVRMINCFIGGSPIDVPTKNDLIIDIVCKIFYTLCVGIALISLSLTILIKIRNGRVRVAK